MTGRHKTRNKRKGREIARLSAFRAWRMAGGLMAGGRMAGGLMAGGLMAGAVVVSLAALAPGAVPATAQTAAADAAGKPPQPFVSLKASEVNLRKGPGLDYPIAWVYRRAGLPVRVKRVFQGWKEVEDAEGTSGWVVGRLLSNRRTALIRPTSVAQGQQRPQEPLAASPGRSSRAVALIEAGVIADLHACDGTWCNVSVGDYTGYIEQQKLWGLEPGEMLE